MKNPNKNLLNINLNINKDDNELNDFLYSWDIFGKRPNKLVIHNNYSGSLFIELMNKYSMKENQVLEIIPSEEQMIMNEKIFASIQDEIYVSYIILDKNTDFSIVSEVTFFYASNQVFEKIQTIVEQLNSCLLDFSEDKSNNLNTVISSQTGLDIESIDSEFDQECFDLFYSKQNSKQINKLIKEVKKSTKGFSILYGERGTGKTSSIKYLASKLDRIVIFIPNNLVDSTINNSDFRKFLKRYHKPIIVLDDCEMLLSEFFNKSNITSNNLLQMVDGLLSDSIQANIITIFNVDSENDIDHTLLDCNNLIKTIKFEYLSTDEANELSEYLGHKRKYKNKSKLIDIIKNRDNSTEFEIGF